MRTYTQLNRLRYYGLIGVKSHSTKYSPTEGCFPLCEGCWSELSTGERMPYYDMLVIRWMRDARTVEDMDTLRDKRLLIREAVRAGL